jgi:hypothetical protein
VTSELRVGVIDGANAARVEKNRDDCTRHVWVDPAEPLATRRAVVPIIGTLPEMMKRGRTYRCETCGAIFVVPPR